MSRVDIHLHLELGWSLFVFARRSGVHFRYLAIFRVAPWWYLIECRRLAGVVLVLFPNETGVSHGDRCEENQKAN